MREMKDSGIEWLGEIPADWNVYKGKYLLKYMQKPVRPTDEVITCFRDGEVTLRSNRREDGFTMSDKEIGYQGIDIDDLVVHGMDGFAGSIGISDSRGKASPVLNVLDTVHNKKYIMYYLRSMAYSNVFLALATGIRVRSCDLRWNKLAELPYPVPSIEEQKKIADYIDMQLERIDALTADIQTQIETLEQYKKSVITEAVTKGLNPDVEMKDSGIEWIGTIPSNYKIGRIKQVVKKVGSGKTPKGDESLYSDGNILFLRSQNVYNTGLVIDNPPIVITEEIDRTMSNTRVKNNDVLLNITGGSIGRCCVYNRNDKANVNQHVCIIRVMADRVLPSYMQYFWVSNLGQTAISLFQTGGNREGMSANAINNTPFILADIKEQQMVVDYLDKRCNETNHIIDNKKKQLDLLKDYKKSLIYEYVTGKKEVL